MKFRLILSLLLLIAGIAYAGNSFDKPGFYNAMASDNMAVIDAQLNSLKTASMSEKEAYEGALLMKKAGLVSKTKDKMSFFKAGRTKLENAIKKDGANVEFRFLRLILQENAPKIVNYRDAIEADAALVRAQYKTQPPVVQQAIIDYSKKSKVLKALGA